VEVVDILVVEVATRVEQEAEVHIQEVLIIHQLLQEQEVVTGRSK
jgi:hypothetical protein